jgi:hypothetical protein
MKIPDSCCFSLRSQPTSNVDETTTYYNRRLTFLERKCPLVFAELVLGVRTEENYIFIVMSQQNFHRLKNILME